MEMRIKSENPTISVFKAIYKVSNIPFFSPTVEKNLGQASRRDYLVEFIRNAKEKLNKKNHVPVARAMWSNILA